MDRRIGREGRGIQGGRRSGQIRVWVYKEYISVGYIRVRYIRVGVRTRYPAPAAIFEVTLLDKI